MHSWLESLYICISAEVLFAAACARLKMPKQASGSIAQGRLFCHASRQSTSRAKISKTVCILVVVQKVFFILSSKLKTAAEGEGTADQSDRTKQKTRSRKSMNTEERRIRRIPIVTGTSLEGH